MLTKQACERCPRPSKIERPFSGLAHPQTWRRPNHLCEHCYASNLAFLHRWQELQNDLTRLNRPHLVREAVKSWGIQAADLVALVLELERPQDRRHRSFSVLNDIVPPDAVHVIRPWLKAHIGDHATRREAPTFFNVRFQGLRGGVWGRPTERSEEYRVTWDFRGFDGWPIKVRIRSKWTAASCTSVALGSDGESRFSTGAIKGVLIGKHPSFEGLVYFDILDSSAEFGPFDLIPGLICDVQVGKDSLDVQLYGNSPNVPKSGTVRLTFPTAGTQVTYDVAVEEGSSGFHGSHRLQLPSRVPENEVRAEYVGPYDPDLVAVNVYKV